MSGQATYAVLDLCFLLVAVAVGVVASVVAARRARARARSAGARAVSRWVRTTIGTGAISAVVLVAMTVVFDTVIVGLRIVAYDPARISGVHLGLLPVEDLAYALAAVVLLPSLAVLVAPRQRDGSRSAADGSRSAADASRTR